jgi:Domain of unknown function (DUF5615)
VAEPELNSDGLIHLVSNNTGIARRLVDTAVRYWAAYPGEADAEIVAADAAEKAPRRPGCASVNCWPDSLREPALLLDEMFTDDIAQQLRAKGHDVISVAASAALVGLPDDQILAYATAGDEHWSPSTGPSRRTAASPPPSLPPSPPCLPARPRSDLAGCYFSPVTDSDPHHLIRAGSSGSTKPHLRH